MISLAQAEFTEKGSANVAGRCCCTCCFRFCHSSTNRHRWMSVCGVHWLCYHVSDKLYSSDDPQCKNSFYWFHWCNIWLMKQVLFQFSFIKFIVSLFWNTGFNRLHREGADQADDFVGTCSHSQTPVSLSEDGNWQVRTQKNSFMLSEAKIWTS